MYNVKSKTVLWTNGANTTAEGPGRAVSADITAKFRGAECWVAGGATSGGPWTCKGVSMGMAAPQSVNFLAWWDGDLLRELLNGTQIDKYEGGRLLTATGCSSNNSTKSTPNLSGDFFGDWREEVMWRTADNTALRIYSTTIPTNYKFRTLMHDPQYRVAIAWQNTGYNQPPHVSYFLGDGMKTPAKPTIAIVKGGTVVTDVEEGQIGEESVSISCFPNPFTHDFTINGGADFDYAIYNVAGISVGAGKAQTSIQVGNNLPVGMYIVKIKNEKGSKVLKVTKE
jgi:rhamnogalacturonan endolyase